MDALLARVIDEADAGQLPVLIDDWLETGDARHWIARALRIDLAVLVERPELAVPCLLRRCTWFGDEYPRFVNRAPPPADAAAVRGLARSWEHSWRRPYLRSLRTPRVPLDGGVVEEYRSGAAGPLWLTPSHVGLGDDVAWDRASGRRVRMAMPAPREPVWQLVRERRELVSSSHVLPLAIDVEYAPSQLFELDDELALVTASYDEPYGEGFSYRTYCIDLRTGTRLFQLDRGCTAAARDAETIYTDEYGTFASWSLTGELRASGTVAGSGLVFAADGTVATRTEQIIRVYDPTRIITARFAEPYRQGLVALSPDATRALTGQVLCDAHTGEQLAQLQFHGIGNWLEGGPPPDCRALCDDVVVEILPFGYRLWDSTTGEILVDDRDHDATRSDAVAFAPNGRTHAILKNGVVRVYDNHTLRVLHEKSLGAGARGWDIELRLSHDGSTLWWGERAAPLRPIKLRAGRATLTERRSAAISDGIASIGHLALPIDDAKAELSADGRVILGWSSHYVVG